MYLSPSPFFKSSSAPFSSLSPSLLSHQNRDRDKLFIPVPHTFQPAAVGFSAAFSAPSYILKR
ncbi:hypothetical protein CLOM621_08740 [Clostridium sp. M62/1]|nr:hypothetical protein CLOM621_08740 [Clostridium sp. M62/1]